MERYDFYKKHKRGSVKCRYPFDVNEYEKLIDCLKKKERPLFIMNYIKDVKLLSMLWIIHHLAI